MTRRRRTIGWCLSSSETLLTKCSRFYAGKSLRFILDQQLLLTSYRIVGAQSFYFNTAG